MTPDCSLTGTAATTAANTSCLKAWWTNASVSASANKFGFQYYQPKEVASGVYSGLPRMNAKDTIRWLGFAEDVAGLPSVKCGADLGVAMSGASALVAGAAIAFGAVALY
jgi:hypothetical protein